MTLSRNGVSGAAAIAMFIIGVLVGVGGYYFVATDILPSQNAQLPSQSTTSALSQSSLGMTSTSSCLASKPLTLMSVNVTRTTITVGQGNSQTTYGLLMVWSNCADQSIKFDLSTSLLNFTYSILGTRGYTSASGTCELSPCGAVSAHGTTSVNMILKYQISPNATIQGLSGTAIAIDPVTGQGFSASVHFVASPPL